MRGDSKNEILNKNKMAIFDEKLTPEEIESGFSTEEADNETFSLDAFGGSYPAEMPNYNEATFYNAKKSSAETEFTAVEEVLENDIFNEENTVNNEENNFNEEIEEVEITIPEIQDREETNEIQEITVDDVFNILDDDSENFIAENNNTVSESENENVSETQEIIPEKNDNENVTVAENETTVDTDDKTKIDLGDDFLRMLAEDIQRDNSKQSVNIEEDLTQETEGTVQFNTPSEIEIGDEVDSISADLITGEIETNKAEILDKSETFNEEVEENNQTISENIEKNADNENIKIENTKVIYDSKMENNNKDDEIKQQEKKKATILIISIVGLASLLIIGGIIGYLYLSSKNNIRPAKDETTQTIDSVGIETEIVESEILEDTVVAETDLLQDTTQIEEVVEKVETPQPTVQPERPAPPAQQPRTVTERTPERTVTERRVPTQPQRQTQPPKATTTGVYTVQIYSSPSRTDAESRLNMLRQKNIVGEISTQQIKGTTWHRVRFGSYSSYEEALAAANKYGFNDAWIERVK